MSSLNFLHNSVQPHVLDIYSRPGTVQGNTGDAERSKAIFFLLTGDHGPLFLLCLSLLQLLVAIIQVTQESP